MQTEHTSMLDIPRVLYKTACLDRPSEGQCDACAAILPVGQRSTRPSTGGTYALDPGVPLRTVPLTDGYCATLGRGSAVAVLNRAAQIVADHFEQARPLDVPETWRDVWGDRVIRSALEQMVALGLLVPEEDITPVSEETPSVLAAWLHVTDRCNMRCVYCYLPHTGADMSMTAGRAAVEALVRSALAHGYPQIKLKYAGGEPLLRSQFVLNLHRHVRSLAESHGLEVDGVVLSNGTLLTSTMVEHMQAVGLRLMISLDGLGEFHDHHRAYADGRGSADDLLRAVDLALDGGLVPDISITVSGRTVDGLPALLAWVLARDLPFSLNFYRENDLSLSHADLQLEKEHVVQGLLAAYKTVEANLPHRSLLASLVDRANLSIPHVRACSVGHSYLVFDQRGQVAKCQMDMGRTVTDVCDPDPLSTLRESAVGIRNPRVDERPACRDCQWQHWCAGGCPLMAYRATGQYDTRSPNCDLYRELYPEVVRLEGLRLLRYAGEQ